MARMEATAEASLAPILARSRLGIAIAAMIRMIATTISNSMRENPFERFMRVLVPSELLDVGFGNIGDDFKTKFVDRPTKPTAYFHKESYATQRETAKELAFYVSSQMCKDLHVKHGFL